MNKVPLLVHTGWWHDFFNKITQSWHVVIDAGPCILAGVWFIGTDTCFTVFVCVVCIARRAFISADTWSAWFYRNGILLFDAVVLVLAGLALVPLTASHIYVAVVNMTTWELMSSHRITYLQHLNDENPFHRGYLRNIVMFCCVCRLQNWEHLYSRYTQKLSQSPA